MGVFGKLFGKDKKEINKEKKGFTKLIIESINRETPDTVSVSFDVPASEKGNFQFIPGQYLNFSIELEGKEERRSYSICSAVNESLTIAVKEVANGSVSKWFNKTAKVGDEINVSYPEGNFQLTDAGRTYVAFAAGSGITPIFSIAKAINLSVEGKLTLFYGSKTEEQIIFHEGLKALNSDQISTHFLLSQEEKDGFISGKLTKEKTSELIKENLDLLKAHGFYICGPEEMIVNVSEVLKTFGVPDDKIHFELFTTPVIMESKPTTVQADFEGESEVSVIIDDETTTFKLSNDGKSILDQAELEGVDAPYSCRGGVCSTCRAKVLEGSAVMDSNMALTDKEVADGFILTCQAHPNSEKITVSYDE